jgi:predicted AAA+ superfamily ATPase
LNFRKLYANQKFSEIHSLVKREIYLSQLRQLRDVPLIKAIAGVRRSGKSTLLQQLVAELLAAGVLPQNIQHYNLEAPENTDFEHWKDFYYHIKENLPDEGMSYILLDEIQMLNGFERLLDGLHILKNVDLYVTGSNAHLLSGELATILNRAVGALALGYEKPQPTYALCAVFLRHIFAVAGNRRVFFIATAKT